METETIILGAIGVAVAAAALKKLSKLGDPNFLETVKAFKPDQKWREKTFHHELKAYLERRLSAGPLKKVITEAGLPGSTARVDLHALYGDTDYLITVKKGLSSQKTMTLVGEVSDVLHHWRGGEGRETVLVILLYGDDSKAGGDDHLMKLMQLVSKAAEARDDIKVEFVAV